MLHTPRIILLLDASRGFGRGLLSGIARYSALNGPWTFYRKPPAYLKSDPDFSLDEFRAWKPDGIICSMENTVNFAKLRVPMIGYDPAADAGSFPFVTSDHEEAGRLAARHLLELGHRNFAFCGFNTLDWSRQRCSSFCSTIREAGFEAHVYQEGKDDTAWSKEEALVSEWIRSLPRPVGMFCVNDDRAANVMEICRTLGLGVPEELSVIGADDDEYICELENPPLSSIRIASDQAGYEAARLLHNMMLGKEKMERQRIIAPAIGISIRQSTDVLMVQNTEVRKALRFIREHINHPIKVSDVVSATALSHRALNDQFHKELGSSVGRQLTRARIDFICRLLSDTEMQIQEIATTVGYEDDRHFARYFKRATGHTPQAYRRKILMP